MNSYNYLVAATYGVSLFADPCVLISAAVAVTLGGRAFVWGLVFGAAHFVFGVCGLFLSSQAAHYSDLVGHSVAAVLLVVVLSHVVRHAFNHGCDTCQSEDERAKKRKNSRLFLLVGSLFAVVAHALGAGFVIGIAITSKNMLPQLFILLCGATVLGLLITTVVRRRSGLGAFVLQGLKFFPGIAATLLCSMLGLVARELVGHFGLSSPSVLTSYYMFFLFGISLALGAVVQSRSTSHKHTPEIPSSPIQIGRSTRFE